MPHRFLLMAAIAAVSVIATLGASQPVGSQGVGTTTTEVTINARQLDDGRVEFALRQREGDGWSERLLAQRRYLPANVGHSKWLSSSPYTVAVTTEVTINARQLDDGRVEFALRQREGDGWSERLLAQRRYLPANVGHSKWLSSSPYTVTVNAMTGEEETVVERDQANAEIEIWTVTLAFDNPSQLTHIPEGWWKAAFSGTSQEVTWPCFASLVPRARTTDISFGGMIGGRESKTHSVVFKVGLNGDAPAGNFSTSLGQCRIITVRITSASQLDIDTELVRREGERQAAEVAAQRRAELERVQSLVLSGDQCDIDNPSSLASLVPGYLFCAHEDSLTSRTIHLEFGTYRLLYSGPENVFRCGALVDEDLTRPDRIETGSVQASGDGPRDGWKVRETTFTVGDEWRDFQRAQDLLPGKMWVFGQCGNEWAVVLARVHDVD